MSRISDKFKELKKQGKKALITFITAGDPSLATTEKLVYSLEKAGANIIELGIPFSDPLADGPTIQASHARALKTKTTVNDVIKLVSKIRKKTQIPIAFMTSYNLIMKHGIEKFVKDSVKAGADGVIVPDLPPEEAGELKSAAKGKLDTIFLAAPTSTPERIKNVIASSTGFIYLISLTGITGERKEISADVRDLIKNLQRSANKPVAVGFGISKPEHVKEVCRYADGAIVGSAIIKIIEKNLKKTSMVKSVARFVETLAKACK